MIKPWLDPVIASKINFTSSNADLARWIEQDNLQGCYGGKDDWEYNYIEPVTGENERMQSEKKADYEAERSVLVDQFEKLSVEWAELKAGSVEAKTKDAERRELAKQLSEGYWNLDPYVRARSYYDRSGVIETHGKIDYKAAQ